ncbi:MAG: hypothetical protein NWE89_01935 [Candidatus Bathyarchaeota archaeon]|nr:hypothetical protein [Candidatus Bathyarchaeota archaeon]
MNGTQNPDKTPDLTDIIGENRVEKIADGFQFTESSVSDFSDPRALPLMGKSRSYSQGFRGFESLPPHLLFEP